VISKDNYLKLIHDLGSTKLVAVSKRSSAEEIKRLYDYGQRIFGENRVDDLLDKATFLKDLAIEWHFIGNLQSNKLGKLLQVPGLKLIHSIHSNSLLDKFLKHEQKCDFLLQFNSSGELEKAGFDAKALKEAAVSLKGNPHFRGLMTMGPIRTDDFEGDTKKAFKLTTQMHQMLCPDLDLSMGMSQDYRWALEFKPCYVRIGSALFD
jgi:PLP dependent protein